MAIMRQEVGEKVFAAIGDSAPAFGMFGTLVGLVQMLSTMSDPTSIGRSMAVALLTTLYGVLIAHLVALPISEKLRRKSEQERENRLLIIEGVVQIHDRQNPTVLVDLLEAYLPEKQRLGVEGAAQARNRRTSDAKVSPAGAALRRRTADREP